MVSLNRDALTEKILEGARISTEDALELYRLPLTTDAIINIEIFAASEWTAWSLRARQRLLEPSLTRLSPLRPFALVEENGKPLLLLVHSVQDHRAESGVPM